MIARVRRWAQNRSERRDHARRCRDTEHVPVKVYGYRSGVWGPLHRVCRRCGVGLP